MTEAKITGTEGVSSQLASWCEILPVCLCFLSVSTCAGALLETLGPLTETHMGQLRVTNLRTVIGPAKQKVG